MAISKFKIDKFWIWFLKYSDGFGENFDNKKLLDELDHRVRSLGNFSWELGPGGLSANQLVISPGGDSALLPITKQIISLAGFIPDWEFHHAKPPKKWDLIFRIETRYAEIEIDASGWQYVLLRYDNDEFEIIFKIDDLDMLSDDDKLIASEILLDGILGEENRMRYIHEVDFVEEFKVNVSVKKLA